MDFALIGSALTGALVLIPILTEHFRREAKTQRSENRKLRRLVLAHDQHLFRLERMLTLAGRTPPPRPELLRGADEDRDEPAGFDPGSDDGPDGGPVGGRSSRHARP